MTAPQRIPPYAPFERSAFTQALVDRLRTGQAGEMIAYAELSRLACCDVQDHQGRGFLYRAREIVEKQYRMVYEVVPGQGVKRADEAGTVSMTEGRFRRIRRQASRAQRQVGTIADTERMSPADRLRLMVARATIGLLKVITGRKVTAVLTAQAGQDGKLLEAKEVQRKVLRMFE